MGRGGKGGPVTSGKIAGRNSERERRSGGGTAWQKPAADLMVYVEEDQGPEHAVARDILAKLIEHLQVYRVHASRRVGVVG